MREEPVACGKDESLCTPGSGRLAKMRCCVRRGRGTWQGFAVVHGPAVASGKDCRLCTARGYTTCDSCHTNLLRHALPRILAPWLVSFAHNLGFLPFARKLSCTTSNPCRPCFPPRARLPFFASVPPSTAPLRRPRASLWD